MSATESVIVEREDLFSALKHLSMALSKETKNAELRLDFIDGELRFLSIGVEAKITAHGNWRGFVVASLQPIVSLRELPKGSQLKIQYAENRLSIGNWSIAAKHDANHIEPLTIPLKPTLKDLLKIKYTLTDEEISASAMKAIISKASADASVILMKAQEILRPTGISLRDLEDLLERKYRSISDK